MKGKAAWLQLYLNSLWRKCSRCTRYRPKCNCQNCQDCQKSPGLNPGACNVLVAAAALCHRLSNSSRFTKDLSPQPRAAALHKDFLLAISALLAIDRDRRTQSPAHLQSQTNNFIAVSESRLPSRFSCAGAGWRSCGGWRSARPQLPRRSLPA